MAEKKKRIRISVPKAPKPRVGTTTTPTPPLASQGNQGATFDKIMREKYDWWK